MTLPTDITPERYEKMQKVAAARQRGVVVIEDVTDPHNAEAVVRTADAFGFQSVYLIFENQPAFDPRNTGKFSSSSANKWVDFHLYRSTTACLTHLKAQGYTLIATALTASAENIFTTDLTTPRIALLFGNEYTGLSPTALALADRTLTIPMRGMVKSLNLSVTAAICLYEITRQRHPLDPAPYTLTPDEQATLSEDFLRRATPPISEQP